MKIGLSIIPALLFFTVFGQSLHPSIGQFTAPSDGDTICSFPISIDTTGFQDPGPEVGDTIPDFTLYDMADNAFTISNELSKGKYILLIAGSYTCPVFRNKVASINTVVTDYSLDVSTYVVYEMEAHPENDTSIYFGYVNPGSANISQGILFDQPTTYGERKALIDTMNTNLTLYAPILLDGPCNEYLGYFGPAPNNAYLIDTNGIVVLKHAWYDKYPISIVSDLDSILTGSSSGSNGINGSFTFVLDADSMAYGNPGDVLSLGGTFTNTHPTEDVIIDLERLNNNLPNPSWSSAMCLDVCLGASVSNYTFQMPPGGTQHFTFYFFTGSVDQGDALLEFTNQMDTTNTVRQRFYCFTNTNAIEEISSGDFMLYPNPADNLLIVEPYSMDKQFFTIYDALGQRIKTVIVTGRTELDISQLRSGLYIVQMGDSIDRLIIR